MIQVLKFYADWCQPCRFYEDRAFGPVVEELQVDHRRINIDTEPELKALYGVEKIPTTVLLKDGEVFDTQVGVLRGRQLKDMIAAAQVG